MSKLIGDIKANILLRYATVIFNFSVGVVLARLLTPEDFGLVAIVYVFYNILATIGDMGLGASIVQFNDLKRKDIITLFVFTIIVGLIISIILYSSSFLITYMYNISELKYIVQVFSLSIFFYITYNVPFSINRRNKRFKAIGIVEFLSFFISGFIAIVTAYMLKSYFALVIQLLLYNVLMLIGNLFILKRGNSTFIFSELKDVSFRVSIRKVYKFSRNSALFDITNYFNRNIDNFVIGSFFGTSMLGFYDRAYKLFLFPIHNITKLLNPILHPVLVEYKENDDYMYGFFLKLTRVLAIIGFPLSIFLFFSATDIVQLLYGDKWYFAGEVLRILSIGIGFQMIATSGGVFYYTSNNSKLYLYSGILTISTNGIVLLIGVLLNSFDIVLYGLVISFIVNFVFIIYTINSVIYKKETSTFLASIKNAIFISLMIIIGLEIMDLYFSFSFFYKSIFTLTIFSFGLVVTKEYIWIKELIDLVKNNNVED